MLTAPLMYGICGLCMPATQLFSGLTAGIVASGHGHMVTDHAQAEQQHYRYVVLEH